MKGSLSLADELRAIRGGGVNGKALSKRPNLPPEGERPWKSDLDRMEHTIKEALQTISKFSGVQLPDGVAEQQGNEELATRVDYSTLKDRFRNDLEAFSVTTVSEMAKQSQEQARAALESIRDEMAVEIERTLGQYREMVREKIDPQDFQVNVVQQSQERVAELVRAQTDEFARWVWLTCKGTGTPIPMQIEKLLEPYVEEATALVTGGIQERIQELLHDQEKVVEERFQGSVESLQGQIETLQQAAQQVCEQNADTVVRQSAERMDAAAEDATKNFEGRIHEHVEESVNGVKARLDETTGELLERLHQKQDQMAQDFIHRINVLTAEVEATKGPEITSRMEQAVDGAMEKSLQQLNQATEGSVLKIQETGHYVNDSVEEGFKRVAEMLGGQGEDLSGFRDRILKDTKMQISELVQESVAAMEPRIMQFAEEKIEASASALGKSQDENAADFEARLQEIADGQYRELLDRIQKEAGNAGAQAAAEVRFTSETVMQELTAKVDEAALRLKQQQEESGARLESSVNDTLEGFRAQLAEITRNGMERQRDTIAASLDSLQQRLRLAAEALVTDAPMAE